MERNSISVFIIILFVLGYNLYSQDFNSYILKLNGNETKIIQILNQNRVEFETPFSFLNNKYSKDNYSFLSSVQQRNLAEFNSYYVLKSADIDKISKISNLLNIEKVDYTITPNYIFKIDNDNYKSNDSLFSSQWYLQAINTEKAWSNYSGEGVVIGLIDTGIDFEHPDLKENLWINSKEDINGNGKFDPWSVTEKRNGITGDFNGIDDDGNGMIDDIIGFDFVDQSVANIGDYSEPDPIPEDQGVHGTLVAGVMSAVRNNQIGIAGIANKSKILTAKAFDITGNAESDDIARAILYAALNGARVLNFSFGERTESPIVYDAVKFAYSLGCVMVSSSGNNGWNNEHYPSDHTEVISVGGIDKTLKRSGRANYGSMIDIVAPSVDVMTTDVGASYKLAGGTSLSAPMVSALAAMMLEMNPKLSPAEIRSNMQMAARRIENSKWDVNYGAGILDVSKTLELYGTSNFNIIAPVHQQTFNKDKNSKIHVIGTAASTLFSGYDLAIGSGIMPDKWIITSSKSSLQIIDGNLGELDISSLDEGIYTLSLRVYQQNLNIIEKRIYINITSDKSKIELKYFKSISAFHNDKKVVIIGANTDKKCNLILKYLKKSNNDTLVTRQYDFNSQFHTIILGDEIESDELYDAEAIFFTNETDTFRHKFQFKRSSEVFLTTGFLRKSYSFPRSYLLNQVSDLYSNNKQHIVVNDLSNLFIGDSKIYEFDNNSFKLMDTSREGWITAGIGDSNGDKIPEVFGTSDGRSTLKQAKVLGENPYTNEIFRSQIDSVIWAEMIFDIDKDGIDELVVMKYDNDYGNYYAIYKFNSGKYQLVTRALLPNDLRDISLSRNSLIDDFDSDGNFELVFANIRGHLFVYELNNNQLNIEFIDSTNKSGSIQFLESPDINGDGKPEIMHCYAGTNLLFNENESGTPVWSVRIIKSDVINSYSTDNWSENIYGVRLGSTRQGVFYRNGSSKGDLNGDGKDEIILSLFPNLYIWSFDTDKSEMKPFWYYPSVFSNSAIVNDFDKNGIKEIGISTFSNTSFFEFDKSINAPKVPTNFDGWAISQTSAFFKWDLVNNAKEYALFLVDRSSNPPQAVQQARTITNELVLNQLEPDKHYEFVLASINDEFKDEFSDFTEIIHIYTFPSTIITEILSPNKSNLILKFEGKLKDNAINPLHFVIYNESGQILSYTKSAIVNNYNTILLSYDKELMDGNYKLKILPFRDYYGNFITESELAFKIDSLAVISELYLKNLEFVSETLIRIKFSEIVEKTSAENIENYVMNPFGTIRNAELDPTDNQFVLLNISQEIREDGARGKNYTITAKNILSESGNKMTSGPGNTLGFVISNQHLRKVYVYPNPIKRAEEPEIYFANLTNRAIVTIMTSDGSELLTLTETDGNGGVEWNGRDKNGNYLPSGIYLFKVRGENNDGINVFEETGKFAILP